MVLLLATINTTLILRVLTFTLMKLLVAYVRFHDQTAPMSFIPPRSFFQLWSNGGTPSRIPGLMQMYFYSVLNFVKNYLCFILHCLHQSAQFQLWTLKSINVPLQVWYPELSGVF